MILHRSPSELFSGHQQILNFGFMLAKIGVENWGLHG
jgi:hypothetical protein